MSRKNLFTISADTTSPIDYDELVLRQESDETKEKRAELDERMGKAFKKTIAKEILPYLFTCIAGLAGGACLLSVLFDFLRSDPFSLVKSLIGLALAALAVISFIAYKHNEKSDKLDADTEMINEEYGKLNEISKKELLVPEDAKTLEVFSLICLNDGKEENDITYTLCDTSVYTDGENLCFFFETCVIGFPILEVEGLFRVNKPITFDSFEDGVNYERGKYLEYNIKKIKIDEYDEKYSMTGYYSLRFTHGGEQYEIILPLFAAEPLIETLKTEPIEE